MGLVGDYFSRFYVKFFGICPRVCLKYVAIMRIHFTIQHTKDTVNKIANKYTA